METIGEEEKFYGYIIGLQVERCPTERVGEKLYATFKYNDETIVWRARCARTLGCMMKPLPGFESFDGSIRHSGVITTGPFRARQDYVEVRIGETHQKLKWFIAMIRVKDHRFCTAAKNPRKREVFGPQKAKI